MVTKIGKIHGKIAQEISGKRGFGYDPIFIPKTINHFGQMVYSKKLKIDHRFIAFKTEKEN